MEELNRTHAQSTHTPLKSKGPPLLALAFTRHNAPYRRPIESKEALPTWRRGEATPTHKRKITHYFYEFLKIKITIICNNKRGNTHGWIQNQWNAHRPAVLHLFLITKIFTYFPPTDFLLSNLSIQQQQQFLKLYPCVYFLIKKSFLPDLLC